MNMTRALRELNDIVGKKIIFRADFNLPIKEGEVASGSDWRIKSVIPTLDYLSREGAKIIILSHLGRPKGRDLNFSLYPIFIKLKEVWRKEDLFFATDIFGTDVKKQIDNLKDGQAILLENLRFYKEEEENSESFAEKLSGYGDFFVNDAFAASHRAHSSIVGIPKFLESYAGFLLEKEISVLSAVRDKPRRPLVLVMGGAKAETKLKLAAAFAQKSDRVLLGGILANTILHSRGLDVGQSFLEEKAAREIKSLDLKHIVLPEDVLVSKSLSLPSGVRVCAVGDIKKDEYIADIGPKSTENFVQELKSARMIIWNGALGLTELPPFRAGSLKIARAMAESSAEKVIGGGDLINFLAEENLLDKMSYVSTGGGAMLEFLAGEALPGIEVLKG